MRVGNEDIIKSALANALTTKGIAKGFYLHKFLQSLFLFKPHISFEGLAKNPEGFSLLSTISKEYLSGASLAKAFYQHGFEFNKLKNEKSLRNTLDLLCRNNRDNWLSCFDLAPSTVVQRRVFLITMYKSGTDFISTKLSRALSLRLVRILVGDWPTEIVPSWLDHFASIGGLCVHHLQPKENNIKVLINAGIEKVFLHLRDPRQAFLSAFHFEEQLMKQATMAGKMFAAELPKNYFDMEFKDRIECRIYGPLGDYFSEWASGWLQLTERFHRQVDFKVSSYEQLVNNENEYMRDLVLFFGFNIFDFESVKNADGSKHHFRRGMTDEFKNVLSKQQQAYLLKSLSLKQKKRMGWV